jgi:iron(III) transport system ATP-binding protein
MRTAPDMADTTRPLGGGLVVVGLEKSFGEQPVLTGLDLEVPEGSLTAILGPSGSGKTTLLRVIAGFERADRGTVAIGGTVTDDGDHHIAPELRRIGYVPQEGALFPHLTVGRNVAFGVPRSLRRSGVIGDLLELVGMRGMGRRYPHQLSGGQQQRVALARALAVKPKLVLFDEPFSSLDPALRASVRADVQEVLRRAGTTALLVTHDQDEALSWADHVAVIRDGRIGQYGSPEALYAHPADPGVARFLGEANLVAGVVDGASVATALGALPYDAPGSGALGRGIEAVVLVRPEQLDLVGQPEEAPLAGAVAEYQYFGHDAVVRVRPDRPCGPEQLVVRVSGGPAWPVGTRVGIACRGRVLAWPAPERDGGPTPAPGGGEIGPG